LKNKKIISNYIKLALIFIGIIVAVLVFRKWYLNIEELKRNTPVLEGVVTHQINSNEIYNYINDNDTALIYMCVSNDDECRNFENNIKILIIDNSLEDAIIYLDLSDNKDTSKFYTEFANKYQYDKNLLEHPTFLYFENSNISNALSGEELSVDDVKSFLKDISLLSWLT